MHCLHPPVVFSRKTILSHKKMHSALEMFAADSGSEETAFKKKPFELSGV